jgi:DNA polymerase
MPGERAGLPALRSSIQACEGCGLYAFATQAVFGEGPRDAALMLVGEQPGDREDIAGHPFVGPAGQLLEAHRRATARPVAACRIPTITKKQR